MKGGVAFFAAALAAAVFLVRSGLPPMYRTVAFLPFAFGSLMFFQAAFRTCILRAFKRQRETRFGVEKVADPEQVKRHLARARAVVLCSLAAASAATALLFVLP